MTSSAGMGLIIPAASRLSNVLLRYACAGGEKVRFPIFVGNTDRGLMSSLCTAPGTAFISLTDNAKQSANSATRAVTCSRWSLSRSGPMVTSSSIFSTRSALCGMAREDGLVETGEYFWFCCALELGADCYCVVRQRNFLNACYGNRVGCFRVRCHGFPWLVWEYFRCDELIPALSFSCSS